MPARMKVSLDCCEETTLVLTENCLQVETQHMVADVLKPRPFAYKLLQNVASVLNFASSTNDA